jgi:hypothetical protein
MRFIHDDAMKLLQMVQRMHEFHEPRSGCTFHRYEQDGRRIVKHDRVRAIGCVATPLWPNVGVKPNTPKVGDLESSGTPECLELNKKGQNTFH